MLYTCMPSAQPVVNALIPSVATCVLETHPTCASYHAC
jgi:hypothetical protein